MSLCTWAPLSMTNKPNVDHLGRERLKGRSTRIVITFLGLKKTAKNAKYMNATIKMGTSIDFETHLLHGDILQI